MSNRCIFKKRLTNYNSPFCSVRLQVEEVTNIMKENVNKMFVRGDQLEDLNERSENLRTASDGFYSASSRYITNQSL